MNFDAMFVEMFELAVWGERCKDFNLRPLAVQITMGHLRGDRLRQKLPGKKLFQKKKLRQKVILEWKKEIAIMHMYPIQTVGSSCPTFPASAARKKNNVFITFSPLLFLTSSTLCLESASIQKYLYKRCNFHFPSPPPPPRAQKLKFHRRTLGDGNLHISQTSIQIFRWIIFTAAPILYHQPPSLCSSDKGLEHTGKKPLCMLGGNLNIKPGESIYSEVLWDMQKVWWS